MPSQDGFSKARLDWRVISAQNQIVRYLQFHCSALYKVVCEVIVLLAGLRACMHVLQTVQDAQRFVVTLQVSVRCCYIKSTVTQDGQHSSAHGRCRAMAGKLQRASAFGSQLTTCNHHLHGLPVSRAPQIKDDRHSTTSDVGSHAEFIQSGCLTSKLVTQRFSGMLVAE